MTDRFHVSLRKWSAFGVGPLALLECVPDKAGSAFYMLAGNAQQQIRQPVRFCSIWTCQLGAFLRIYPAQPLSVAASQSKPGVYFLSARRVNYGAAVAHIHASKRYSQNNTSNDGWFWSLHGLR